ncbi:glycosyltransferase [Calditrichota bacterium]
MNYNWENPPETDFDSVMSSLRERNIRRVLWVFTGGQNELKQNKILLKKTAVNFPSANITVLTVPEFSTEFQNLSPVNIIITLEVFHAIKDKDYQDQLLEELRSIKVDLALNLMTSRSPLDDLLTIGSEARWRVAIRETSISEKSVPDDEIYTSLIDKETLPEIQETDGTEYQKKATGKNGKIRVAMLCSADHGGAGNAAYRLHKGFQSIDVDSTMFVLVKQTNDPSVRVLPPDIPGQEFMQTQDNDPGIPAWKTASSRWNHTMASYSKRPAGLEAFTDPTSSVRLEKFKEIIEADVINLHWISGLLDYQSALPILKEKTVIWTLHDMNAFTGGCHYSAGCEKFLQSCGACPALGSNEEIDISRQHWNAKNELYNNLNINVVAPSKWLADTAKVSGLFSKFPVSCIPYGLPLETFKPNPTEDIRKIYNIHNGEKVVLFGAQRVSNSRKGFNFLLEAIKKIVETPEKQPVIFATFGHQPPEISLPHPYRMLHFGSVEDEETIASIYSLADVFVIPSLEDNLPNTVLESLACGTPVVGFSIGGIPDMVDHKQTGFLAPPFDTTQLAEGILWTLSESEKNPSISVNCRSKAVRDYPLSLQAERYIKLFRSII